MSEEKKKILIVDDDEDIVTIISKMLQGEEWDVKAVYNGVEALEKVSSFKPDIILLDIMMPEMSGIEVLKKIKKSNPDTRIIMITAFGDIETYLDSMEFGAFEYINKPFETQELLQMIQKVASL